jgi:transcription elongation factor GreB
MKNPMTKPGYQRLLAERDELMRVTRPKVVKGVTEAAAEGDRSENAEYTYGKKRLREIDKRLQYLSILLKDVQVVEVSDLRGTQVCFGSTVEVIDDEGHKKKWTIVGDGESDHKELTISWKSPVAKALLGKSVGNIVEIERPKGTHEFEIVALYFGDHKVASSS